MRKWINLVESADLTLDYDAIVAFAHSTVDWSDDFYAEEYLRDQRRDLDELDGFDCDDPEFRKWFASEIESEAFDAYHKISRRMQGGRLQVYRAITAPHDWAPGDRHPGLYWSWDVAAAEPHWGSYEKGHTKWIMEATVDSTDIDWVATLAMNSLTSYRDEKEIRIKEGVPIHVTDHYTDFKGRRQIKS